ncbi:MAG TPA: TatD family hydrolase [Polyangiaceae bacterium]
MFDSHCHLTDISEPENVLSQARGVGVTSVLCCGYNATSNAAVAALRNRVGRLPIALGLHPWYVDEPIEPVLSLIETLCPVAIGECGLDGYDRDPEIPPIERQLAAFEAQLELAARLDLPVTVHSRQAVNIVIAVTAHFPSVRGVLHAYSGSYEQARPLLERGWMIGIGGGSTRPAARRIRRMAERLALTEFLFETDAPAIGLEGVSPPWVRPHHILHVARAFSELRDLDYDQVVVQSDQNADRMFGPTIWSGVT